MRHADTALTTLLVIIGVFTTPGLAAGQICAGSPAVPGHSAALGAVGWSERAIGYDARFLMNPEGPLGLSASANLSRSRAPAPDFTAYSIGGGLNYQLAVARAALCPSLALGFARTEAQVPGGETVVTRSVTTTAALRLGLVAFEGMRFRVAPFLGGPGTLSLAMNDSGDLHTNSVLAGTAGVLMVMSDRVFGVGEVSVVEGGRTLYAVRMGVLLP